MPRCSFSSFSFSSGAVSNSGLIPSTWLSAFFYSWFLFFSVSFPISLVFHFLSFSARTAFYFNHLREWSGHNELGILYGLHGGIRCGKKWYWAPWKPRSKPMQWAQGGLLPAWCSQGMELWLLQLLLVHKASTGPSHSFPAVWLGNIFGSRKRNCSRDLYSAILANQDGWWNIYLSGLDVQLNIGIHQCEDEHQGSWHGIMSVQSRCNECLLSNFILPWSEEVLDGCDSFLFVCLFALS